MASSSSQISPTLFITILVLLLYPLCSVADTGSSPSPSPQLSANDTSPPPATPSPSPSPSNFLSPPAPPSSDPSPDSPSPAPAPSPESGTDEKKSPAPAPALLGNVGHENQPSADLDSNETSSGGMSGRQKAGIAVGVIASVLIVGIGGFVYKKRQQNLRRSQFGYEARREYL